MGITFDSIRGLILSWYSFLYLNLLFHHHFILVEYSVSVLQPPVQTCRVQSSVQRTSYLFMVLLAGLTRQHIYSQQLLTVSVTSLHRLHLGSYQSHRYNDLVLIVYFSAAAFSSSLSSAFYCLWSSQQVIIWSCKKIKRTVRALIKNSMQL